MILSQGHCSPTHNGLETVQNGRWKNKNVFRYIFKTCTTIASEKTKKREGKVEQLKWFNGTAMENKENGRQPRSVASLEAIVARHARGT